MKKFREEIKGYLVDIYFDNNDLYLIEELKESKRHFYQVNNLYSVAVDQAHIPQIKKHFHLFKKENELLAMNFDGTSHDGYHNVRLPNVVQDWIKSNLSNIEIPPNGIIESVKPQDLENGASIQLDLVKKMLKNFNVR